MELKAKNNFYQLLRQFEIRDEQKLYYNGYTIEERGILEFNLKNAYDAFIMEFESNLLDDKAYRYIEVLLTGLDAIEVELRFQLREHVTAYREPLTEKEFPDALEREQANKHQHDQYIMNQQHLIEQAVNFQLYYLNECRVFIGMHKENLISQLLKSAKISAEGNDSADELKEDEIVNSKGTMHQLCFNCNRNELAVLFWLFKKSEFIETGRNDLVSFIEGFFVYKGDNGEYRKMSSINSLIYDFEKGAKNPGVARTKVTEMFEASLQLLKYNLETFKSTEIGEK